MYWGNYQGSHYSGLNQIDAGNVAQLQAAWTFPMPGESVLEATPIVVDGVMYDDEPANVAALDASTGRQIWRFNRPQKVRNPNRDQSVQPRRVDRRQPVVLRHARRRARGPRCADRTAGVGSSGRRLHAVVTASPARRSSCSDRVIVGITGGEFGARGFLDAYDSATGKRLWRWYAVPGPGEFGNDTWLGDSWAFGGSPMWLTGSSRSSS